MRPNGASASRSFLVAVGVGERAQCVIIGTGYAHGRRWRKRLVSHNRPMPGSTISEVACHHVTCSLLTYPVVMHALQLTHPESIPIAPRKLPHAPRQPKESLAWPIVDLKYNNCRKHVLVSDGRFVTFIQTAPHQRCLGDQLRSRVHGTGGRCACLRCSSRSQDFFSTQHRLNGAPTTFEASRMGGVFAIAFPLFVMIYISCECARLYRLLLLGGGRVGELGRKAIGHRTGFHIEEGQWQNP